jgi:hypothetical protein
MICMLATLEAPVTDPQAQRPNHAGGGPSGSIACTGSAESSPAADSAPP